MLQMLSFVNRSKTHHLKGGKKAHWSLKNKNKTYFAQTCAVQSFSAFL